VYANVNLSVALKAYMETTRLLRFALNRGQLAVNKGIGLMVLERGIYADCRVFG
jgi:hypothetical protein